MVGKPVVILIEAMLFLGLGFGLKSLVNLLGVVRVLVMRDWIRENQALIIERGE